MLRDASDGSGLAIRAAGEDPSSDVGLTVRHFLCGRELAAELGVRLAVEEGHSLTEIYECFRTSVYRPVSTDQGHAVAALTPTDPDDRLTRLALRLTSAEEGYREPQALILSTSRRGIAACLRHIFAAQGVPTKTLELAQLPGALGTRALARTFPALRYLLVDAADANGAMLQQLAAQLTFLRVFTERVVVVLLCDDRTALAEARRRMDPRILATHTLPGVLAAADLPTESPLTPRERSVLQLVAEGATNQQAATRLGISIATVKTYLERAQLKLKSIDRVSTVTVAVRRGWL